MSSQPVQEKSIQIHTMMLWWISIDLLSIGWYPLTGIYLPTNIHYIYPVWFGVAAFVLAVLSGAVTNPIAELHWSGAISWILLVSALFFTALIPSPYNIGAILVATSVLVSLLSMRSKNVKFSRILNRITSSAFVCGLILLVQAAILPFLFLFASRFHRVETLPAMFDFVFSVFGASASHSNALFHAQFGDKVYSFIPSFDLLGLYPMLNVLAGGTLLFFILSVPKRTYILLAVVLLMYAIIRLAAVTLIFAEIEQANVFWRLDFTAASLIPLPWVLSRFVLNQVGNTIQPLRDGFDWNKPGHIAYLCSLCALVICVAGFFGFVDPGVKKQGRILIDEFHSNWEWSTEEFNTSWYGEKSTYNYWSLAEYLQSFYTVDKQKKEITKEQLSNYDILVIKTPTEAFTKSEIDLIKQFVADGGGLFLVGDHTNVFGITTNLNPLASEFGVKFRYDAKYDLNGELSLYEKPVVLPHPTVMHMPKFMFATGCMLDAPLMAENAIIGYGLKSVYLDYSRPNFFPKDANNTERMEFGLFVQAAGISYGKGRVFFFTDSTVWSNFYMFIPGKPELLLGITEWLNRRNSPLALLRAIFGVVAFGSFISSIAMARVLGKRNLILFSVVAGLILTPCMIQSFDLINRASYPVPKEHTNYIKVNFENQHSDIELPVYHTTQRIEKSYHTFYVSVQRLGVVPKFMDSYSGALAGCDVVAVINPVAPFSSTEVKETREFLERGGKLLLIDNPARTGHSVSNDLLSRLGLSTRMNYRPPSSVAISRFEKDTLMIKAHSVGEVTEGQAILFARQQSVQTKDLPPILQQRQHIEHIPADLPMPGDAIHLRNLRTQQDHRPGSFPGFDNYRSRNAPANVDTTTMRPLMSVTPVGKGSVVVLASSSLFTDQEMGYTSTRPNENQRRIYELEYWIFRDVLGLGERKSAIGGSNQ